MTKMTTTKPDVANGSIRNIIVGEKKRKARESSCTGAARWG